jgi:hypothetical protein
LKRPCRNRGCTHEARREIQAWLALLPLGDLADLEAELTHILKGGAPPENTPVWNELLECLENR